MTVRIGRRKFLGVVGGAAVTWPVKAWSQGAAKRLVAGLGYVDSRDFGFVPRYAE